MKLTTKTVLVWLLSVVLPLGGFAVLALQTARTGIGEQARAALQVAAARELDGVVGDLEQAAAQVRDWSGLREMQDVLIEDATGDLAGALARLLRNHAELHFLAAVDTEGRTVAGGAGESTLQHDIGRVLLRSALAGQVRRGQLHRLSDGRIVAPVAVPLYADYAPETVIGALFADIDWQLLSERLRNVPVVSHAQDEQHGIVLVSGRDGTVLYATEALPGGIAELRTPPTQSGSAEVPWGGRNWVVASAVLERGTGGPAHRIGNAADDLQALAPGPASFNPIVDDLRIHFMVSADTAYAPLRKLRDRMLVSLAPALGLASLLTLLALRSLVRPILALSKASDRLAANDFDCPLPATGNDELGRLSGSFARMRDAVARHRDDMLAEIAERRRAEQELTEAHQSALEAGQAKMRFLAAMSHEIRTPINGVLGMTDLLLKGELKPQQRRFAESIERSGEVLLGVVNDILDLSRIEAGRFQLDEAPFELRAVLEDAVDMLAESAERKHLELGCVVPAELPTALRGDVLRLRQVLTNLLGNAVKFTETGEIALRVECLRENHEQVLMRFEVRDTGIGIEQEALTRIFDSFSQADDSTTRRFGGTGLGLAICRHLVDLMEGEMGVESRPDEGSTFWFTCTFARAAAQVDADEEESLAGLRVLVVDDNATNREILSHQLSDLGAEHATAAGGEEALEALLQAQRRGDAFEAVVIDQQMPGMDGLQLARAVRAQESFANVPLVLLTSLSGDGDGNWRAVGVESRLTKPIRRSELFHCLAGACRRTVSPGPHAPGQTQAARRVLAGHRVLLAEDHPVNREVQIAMLELLGCEVSVAEDGEQVLAAIDRERFDLVLMDCDMPVMDGFQATAALRQREQDSGASRHIVIALTANTLAGDRERCLQAGMDDYLSKPVVTDTLRETLLRWLPASVVPASEPDASASRSAVLDEPALDQQIIDGIRASNQEHAATMLRELAERYAASFERDTDALRRALASGDMVATHKLARRLKSNSATLGARPLAARCRAIEMAASAGSIAPGNAAIEDLYREFQRVQDALDVECRRVA